MSLFADWLRSFCTETTMFDGQVGDAHRGVGLVHVLTARARGAERVDAEVVVADLDRDVVREQRRDDHLREARVTAMRGVERREAHEPVLAAFGLEDPVRVLALDGERRGLDPVLLARADVEHLGLEAALRGPAQVHAQQDLRPVLRVGAARVGLDRDDRVAAVVLAAEERVLLQALELAVERRDRGPDLAGEALVHREQLARVVELAAQPVVALEPLRDPGVLRGDRGRALLVVPESRLPELLLELGEPRPQPIAGQR